jgi:GIY-YIG catalytic domain-containing protein
MVSNTKLNADKPNGADFTIDRCRFTPTQGIEVSSLKIDDDKIQNWPMVYILANNDSRQKSAYVGETTSVSERMLQHSKSPEKGLFTSVNIIFNQEFNQSVIKDYENRLIGLMAADGVYKLTNKNEGHSNLNYFSKEKYGSMFDSLWEDLRRMELADKTISEIEESEVFKYSPYKSLSVDQRVALSKIYLEIESDLSKAKPIVVQGMPGTGKTILAIYLLKALRDDEKFKDLNIKIVEPMTSLRNTLKESLKGVSGLNKMDVIGPYDLANPDFGYSSEVEKPFDILLIDESHRLTARRGITNYKNYDEVNKKLGLSKESTQLDWVLKLAKLPIFFYDASQSIKPADIDSNSFEERLGDALKHPIRLDNQMRVLGGTEYLNYISDILNDKYPVRRTFNNYEFVLHDSIDDFTDSFEQKLSEHNLTRMLAGYAWDWKTKGKQVSSSPKDIVIGDKSFRWNSKSDNWVGKGVTNPMYAQEVGCVHTTQGYDLSYAYVIIGPDLKFDSLTGKLVGDKDHYFDKKGKGGATDEQLTQYIKNIYYVLLTRGIYGTHVYVVDDELRNLFIKYF